MRQCGSCKTPQHKNRALLPPPNLRQQRPHVSARTGSSSHTGLAARGWADIQNYKSLTAGGNYDSMQPGTRLSPGTFYALTFDLEPDDEFVPAGTRRAVMIMSSDREFTLW